MNINDERVIKSFRYIKSSQNDFYDKLLALSASHKELAPLIDDLFSSDGEPAKDPFFAVYLRGDRPSEPTALFRYQPEGMTLKGMPLTRLMEYSCNFLSIYNEKIQDRNHKVTARSYAEYDRLLFPYVLSAILAGYSMNSTIGVSISYHLGIFSFTFKNRLGKSMSSSEFAEAMVNDSAFRLLSSGIGVVDKKDFTRAFADEKMSFAHEHGGDFVTIQYVKQYISRETALKDRILLYLEWSGQASRKEISDYFRKSDRLINYALSDLLKDGKIQRIGVAHDPTIKYKIK